MKNILILIACTILYSCGGGSSPDEDLKADYTTVKQQIPLKLDTWENHINSKNFTAAKTISVENGDFWDRAVNAESLKSEDIQITYNFKNSKLNESSFLPEQGKASVSGTVAITQGSLKVVEEQDYTATLYCNASPEQIKNWKLNSLQLK
ncbi:MAG: hypothetical protein N4A59_03955 [Marinifilum sp.]|jgi:hypothetical protein|nr:hypothetical protein [Marinifilum sp.]